MDDAKIKVSIITAVLNAANTIERTIQSVIRQTYSNIEYIIIDGKSTDGTLDIVSKYKEHVDILVSEKDQGIYNAFNKGIQCASGDIIGIINSDDWYEPDAVEKIVSCFMNNSAELVYGTVKMHRKDGTSYLFRPGSAEKLFSHMVYPHPSIFIRKEVYALYGLFDEHYKIAADYELILRYYCKNISFVQCNSVIANFSMEGLSMTHDVECERETLDIAFRYLEYCPDKVSVYQELDERQKWNNFVIQLQNNDNLINHLLTSFWGKKVGHIYIWGTGKWGKYCYRALKKKNVMIEAFIDNNNDKYGETYQGINIICPNHANSNIPILIAVKDKGREIEEQIMEERIPNPYVTLHKLVDVLSLEEHSKEKADPHDRNM